MTLRSDDGSTTRFPARLGIGEVLLLGAGIGFAVGLAEVGVLAFRKLVLGHYLHLNPQIIWLGPVSNALGLAVLAGIVRLIGFRASRRTVLRVAGFLTIGLGTSGVLFWISGLHRGAALLLGLGFGAQAALLLDRRWERLRPRVPKLAALLGGAVAIVGITLNAAFALSGRFASVEAAPPGSPNILWVIWDTVRSENLSLHGYARRTTPALERLVARGIVFEHAIAPSPWTLPSHASMFTGLATQKLEADWRSPLEREPTTAAEVARAHGYRTGGFVANLFYASRESGLARGFAAYDDYPLASVPEFIRSNSLVRAAFAARVSPAAQMVRRWLRGAPAAPVAAAPAMADDPAPAGLAAPGTPRRGLAGLIARIQGEGRKWAPQVNEEFLGWVTSGDERPFFAFLNYFDAHDPYRPPAPFDTAFGRDPRKRVPPLTEGRHYTAQEVESLVSAYDASIAYLDHHFGALLDSLESLGLLDNTIVIVTSDHGEEFGEHAVFTHGHSLYQPALRVPLVIAAPARTPAGIRVHDWVSISDVAATVLSLAGLPGTAVQGGSLERYWRDELRSETRPDTLRARVSYSWAVPDHYPISKGSMESVFADPYKYIRNGDGREELYDLRQDPGERNDLSRMPNVHDILGRLRARVDTTAAH